jgi:small subunit ribosomal protein S16
MKRFGRRNRPFYRINAVDSRRSRDGKVLEELGSYDPHASDAEKVRINPERVAYWLSVGAQPSETVSSFLKTAGLIDGYGNPIPADQAVPKLVVEKPKPVKAAPAPAPAAEEAAAAEPAAEEAPAEEAAPEAAAEDAPAAEAEETEKPADAS